MRSKPIAWAAVPLVYIVYFLGLTATGMLGPDEPRYAAIGRAMAQSGDWITPRLWGIPWFEKPALLYWMTAGATKLGFGAELAPRLPVAICSVAFLIFFWWMLNSEFGCRAAWLSTLILATSGMWIGYSQIGVTDIPM
ncbi:MAG TPA: phospholipid carrier-dependent glycosyltransferase, partial [Candidatus Solibacter sp.]|nr:phospholipid carrier-dependent glycosyltransferase [Candidatus Solibacter sp.]